MLDLVSGDAAGDNEGHKCQRRCRGRHKDWRDPLAGAAQHEVDAECLALVVLEILEVTDQHDSVAGRNAENGQESN